MHEKYLSQQLGFALELLGFALLIYISSIMVIFISSKKPAGFSKLKVVKEEKVAATCTFVGETYEGDDDDDDDDGVDVAPAA
ncbi:hypothetical protein Tsubulata_035444 [Turnera subulata]|uniref:Uncharacterized protein n=1 Tax=Turnera subulata TaxID=218843 RepID=A0A9Q0IZY2_9ROSI|nr:hypothetical protein Tsubulata_035444 [Turnera subulata]